MATTKPSLLPVSGSARDVWELVPAWLAEGEHPIQIMTSGSTGTPKTISLSKAAVIASAQATLEHLGGPGQWMMALPPSGMGGFQVLVRSALAGSEPVFLDDHNDLVEAIQALRSLNAERNYLSLVPTQLHRLANAGSLAELAIFDAVLIGGAALPRKLLAQAADVGVRIVRTYGMTETAGGCIYDGVPLRGVEMRIESDGRIALAGPMLFEGSGDWWVTQDLGHITADGRLEILGRADDVAISGGVNIPLGVVEKVLAEIASVDEIAVVAKADAEWGEAVTAYVVGELSREQATAALEQADYPRAWAPRSIEILESLPLLPGGKIDRQSLRQTLSD